MLDCLRGCNVAARWLMLHATGRHPRLGPAVAERLPPPAAIMSFVMDTALLEFEVGAAQAGVMVLWGWPFFVLQHITGHEHCTPQQVLCGAAQHSTIRCYLKAWHVLC